MPNRIIKESTFTSERIAELSDFAFRLWVGLITQADDAGRGDARPAIIKGRVFALRDRVTVKDIESSLHALAAVGCVSLYQVDGKPYYQFPSWAEHQRVRDAKPKYPGPDDGEDLYPAQQLAANGGNSPQLAANGGLNPIQSESNPNPNPKGTRAGARETAGEIAAKAMEGRSAELQQAVADWLAYKRERREAYQKTGLQSMLTQILHQADEHGDQAVAEVIRTSMSSGYKGIVFDRLERQKPKKAALPGTAQHDNDSVQDFLAFSRELREGKITI